MEVMMSMAGACPRARRGTRVRARDVPTDTPALTGPEGAALFAGEAP